MDAYDFEGNFEQNIYKKCIDIYSKVKIPEFSWKIMHQFATYGSMICYISW